MPRPLPVNLLMAGTGAVLLVSGIGGESVGEVLKGSFGDLTGKRQQASLTGEAGQSVNVADGNAGLPPSPETFQQSAAFAPSPTEFTNKAPTPRQQAKAIARILLEEGITNPTKAQIEAARRKYEQETGVTQFIEVPFYLTNTGQLHG